MTVRESDVSLLPPEGLSEWLDTLSDSLWPGYAQGALLSGQVEDLAAIYDSDLRQRLTLTSC